MLVDQIYNLISSNVLNKNESFNKSNTPELNVSEWKTFKLSDLFDIVKGSNPTMTGTLKEYPYISATSANNGVSDYKQSEKYHPGNVLTVSANGACMDTFYQSNSFVSCGDVNILYPKHKKFNQYIGIFFIPILELEKFRFSYSRKSNLNRVKELEIKLPATVEGKPDYEFMENYIKTLPYSKYI